MAGTVSKILVVSLLLSLTVAAYGGSFRGWFLPEPLKQPVSLRDGSPAARSHGNWVYWVGGRSHYGGGYRGGK